MGCLRKGESKYLVSANSAVSLKNLTKMFICSSFRMVFKLKHQPHKMVKHTQTIHRLLPTNCLSVFHHFVMLALNGWMQFSKTQCNSCFWIIFVTRKRWPVNSFLKLPNRYLLVQNQQWKHQNNMGNLFKIKAGFRW